MSHQINQQALAAAAFGADPGRWPLPSATTPHQHWLRAVAAGGQGRYASARTDLAVLLRGTTGGRLASLAYSTGASFQRQLGWHARGRGADGTALALAGGDPEAAADALVGLAADALGVGRFAAAATLLTRADQLPDPGVPRLAVRRAWVGAELAMATGDGVAALAHARRAQELAGATESTRHRIKSDVVAAAALCSAGQPDAARILAEDALAATERLGLTPLTWALSCLLADVGSSAYSPQQLCDLRERAVRRVRRRGGVWRTH